MSLDVRYEAISLFAGLSQDQIAPLKPYFELARFEAGKFVISEGEPGEEMFILVDGRVKVSKSMLIAGVSVAATGIENPRKVLATLDAAIYPVFGEMALIDRDIRSASVETVEPSQFLKTDRERFFSLTKAYPAAGCAMLLNLARSLAGTVRKSNSEIIKLTTALALALSLGKK